MGESGMADESQWEGDMPMTDEEVRAIGWNPTPNGWYWIGERDRTDDRGRVVAPGTLPWQAVNGRTIERRPDVGGRL